ncbi:hypothetical protein Dimus_013629, partial [Dionaea muscipula]
RNWMNENGLNDVMNLIKGQKLERLFRRRELMHIDACKEFYTNLTMFHYKKHEVARSRVMMRHMSYVISVKDHELSYGDWMTMVFEAFDVPLIDKQGEEPKMYDFFEETFLTMCQLKRENGVWWLGTGDHRRRDDDVEEVNNDAPAGNEEEQNQEFDWEAVINEVALQGEHMEKEVEADESGSGEKFFDAEDVVQEFLEVSEEVPDVPAPASVQ